MSLKSITQQEFDVICTQLDTKLTPLGFECYPFKVKWYNQMVSQEFHLPYDGNCLSFTIISTPDMFEKAFIPYIQMQNSVEIKDPINECMKYYLNTLKEIFSGHCLEVIHDFDLQMPNRRPKVLAQTAAHVSGAAFYYSPDVISDIRDIRGTVSSDNRRLLGYCIHPQYGGWFAIRGVLIFSDTTTESLRQRQPRDVLQSVELKRKLLIAFNTNWRDWSSYRDIIAVRKKYSDLQIKYFQSDASDRKALIKTLIDCHK
ncbi:unnamed protein product [Oppiella nova]|uniref:Cyanocobalamin reductase (cyanide-eliminating) n=1 Tax=Oppiella nova TaxID=334625 RepID=A0A7R9M4K3_9ACAR|nr:unnamed protein product [Oppiella nova]CAG2170409.1 unnamed protein product [Oppiella nova]